MLRLPQGLQESIFNDIIEAEQNNKILLTNDIMLKYKEEIEQYKKTYNRSNDAIKKAISAIRKWKYNKPKKIKIQYTSKPNKRKQVIEAQINKIKENQDIIKEQQDIIEQTNEKNSKLNRQIEKKEVKLAGYNQTMYVQKRLVGLFENIEFVVKDNGEYDVKLKKGSYDLLDGVFLTTALRIIAEMKNGKNGAKDGIDFFNMLKESDKITMFLQQNNLNNNKQEIDITPETLNSLIKDAVKEIN